MGARCEFCDSELRKGTRSKEHVLPNWLQGRLGVLKAPMKSEIRDSDTGKTVAAREHSIWTYVLKDCCKDCNGGWMSKLEVYAMPILEDLFTAKRIISDLATEEQQAIKRWACKTAFAAVNASNQGWSIQLEHLRQLQSGVIAPDRVHVLVSAVNAQEYLFTTEASITYSALHDEAFREKMKSSYKVGVQVGNILFGVVYGPVPARIALNPSIHFPLDEQFHTFSWYQWIDGKKPKGKPVEVVKTYLREILFLDHIPMPGIRDHLNRRELEFIPVPERFESNRPSPYAAGAGQDAPPHGSPTRS